jgi:lipid A 4'-phosphatase
LVAAVALAGLFVAAPEIDLWTSGLFYDAAAGFMSGTWWVRGLHELVPRITIAVAAGIFTLLAYNLVKKKYIGPFNTRVLIYLLVSLAVGPGLVVNAVFKDQWGRARPRDVVEFSGDKQFTPAFVISDQCQRNCSFVAGDPSVVFFFVSFAFLARRRRWLVYAGSIAGGSLVGTARIAGGAHFLSDVVFSGVFVFVVAYVLWHYVFKLDRQQLTG